MKLSKWCKEKGIHYMTGYKWFKEGKIPNAYQIDTGTIFVEEEKTNKNIEDKIVIYCRVSSRERKNSLDLQVERCKNYCINKGYNVNTIYKEIASGMNDNRKELWRMLNNHPTKIIIENKERLTRFGYEYLNKLLLNQGCKIEVIFPNENNEQDLIKDLISIITSFCCRLYGMRRAKNKLQKIKELLEKED